MIKPTVGRKVWFYHPDGGINTAGEYFDGTGHRHGFIDVMEQPIDANIVYVHSDRLINIAGFDCNGHPYARTSVLLWDGAGSPPQGPHCRWMPYQSGQAKANAS